MNYFSVGLIYYWIQIIFVSSSLLQHQHTKRSIDLSSTHSLIHDYFRLPNAVKPTNYILSLIPNLEKETFEGNVKINITWFTSTHVITIHGHTDFDLTHDNVKIRLIGTEDSSVKEFNNPIIRRIDSMPKKSIYEIILKEPLDSGSVCELEIIFNGKIEHTIDGLFKGSYFDENENTQYYLATQMRPIYARTLFPCFDEPSFKATFQVNIARPKSHHTLFNTPVERTEELIEMPDYVVDYFEQTLPMSTFSIGFVTSKFSEMNKTSVVSLEHPKIRIWSRKDFQMNLIGVEEKVIEILHHFKDYWGIDYPLPTLDIVALPEFSTARAVDNWGLIVFKESDLTYPGYYLIAQELVYQWLGLWVTPNSWKDAHANKAIAGFLTTSAAYEIDNGNEFDEKWPMTILYTMYYEYSKRYPHSRITGMKHETTCSKTELVLRMLNYTLGSETLKKGLRSFFANKTGDTFITEDVWDSLTYQAHKDKRLPEKTSVNKIIESWIKKDRLPFVTVIRDYNTNTANVEQNVFLRERPHDLPDRHNLFWMIPIITVTQNNLNFDKFVTPVWMQEIRSIKIDNLPDSNNFIIINPEEIGPFLVNYDKLNWYLLAEYLKTEEGRKTIPVNTRAKLLHDAWNLAYAGELNFDVAFNMTLFMKWERDPNVWSPLFILFDHIGRVISATPMQSQFEVYARSLLIPLYMELGFEPVDGEPKWKENFRDRAEAHLCTFGYRPCIDKARKVYRNWMNSSNPDEINPVSHRFLCTVFQWATQEEWDFGLERVINFPSIRQQSDRTNLLRALTCATQKSKLEKLLNITIIEGNGNFTDNDIHLIFSMLTGGASGYKTLYYFLVNNWHFIKKRFENKTNLWDNLISVATGKFKTREGYDLVSTLFLQHHGEFGSAEHIIEKSLSNIQEETKWSDESFPILEKWLDEYSKTVNIKDDKYFG